MKKFVFLAVSMLLILTGCAPDAPLLTEGLKNAPNSLEAKSTLTFDTNLPVADKQGQALLTALKSGVILDTQIKDTEHIHQTVSLADPSAIEAASLWPSKTKPGYETFKEGNVTYIKTTADNKFLGIKTDDSKQLIEELAPIIQKLGDDFINQDQISLKNVQTLGEESVTLPNGNSEQATHVRVSIDFQEALSLLTYAVEHLNENPDVQKLLGSIPNTALPTAELNADDVKKGLADLATELKSLDVEKLKAAGWDGQITVDSWINSAKQIDQSDFALTAKVPANVMVDNGLTPATNLKSISFTLTSHEKRWNQNKEITYSAPSANQAIMIDDVTKNPELIASFGENSVIGRYLSEMIPQEQPMFVDVPKNYWAYNEISELKDMEIVHGYGHNQFRPEQAITRSEFIVMAVNSLGLEPETTTLRFKDKNQVPSWANEAMQTAVKAGLIKGYNDGTLRPGQKISRAEMVTILVRGMNMPLQNSYQLKYADNKDIPNWAVPYVKTATANGLVKGSTGNRFAPKQNASRAEVAKVLYNIMSDFQ